MPRSRVRGIPVKEISAKVGKDELLNRLEKCCKYLEELDQLEDDPPLGLSELAISLVRQTIIGHGDKLVRLYAAKAIAEILRVYAPDAPYEDEDLREILLLFVGQLGYLADSEGTYYAEYAQLLQNLSRFNTFLIRTDEGVADVLIDLCTTLFDIISGNQEITVKNAVVDIVAVIVREAEFVPKGFIEVILLQLVQKQPAACPRHQLASLIIRKAASDLEPYIRQALVNILLVGHQSDSEIGHHVIEILHQLSLIDDSTLTSVLPQLEFKLKSMDREERLQFTRLLDKMFSAEESSLVQKNPNLWKSFLGRFEDIDVSVRTAAVDSAPHFFASQPMLIGDIADALHSRCHDIEERVRLRAVHVVHDVACKHFDAVPMQLLHDVKERMWDRKWSVREVAIQRLANLFSTVAGSSEPHKSVLWIPASILSGFYRGGFEDRGLIGTCFADILLSGDSDASNRAQRIMCVFTHLDSSAKRVFGDMLKAQVMLQKNFVALIQLIEEKEYPKNKFSSLLALVAKSLSDPQRLLSVADDLEQAFHDEGDLLLLARKAAGPEFSCGEAIEAKECVLKSLAHIPKLQVVLAKVFQLCCPSFVDGECIKLMVHNVCVGTNTTESQLMDTLFLLEILSQNYPVLFRRIEIFQNILKVVQKSYTSTIVCSCFRIFLNVAGTPWTTDSSYRQQLSLLEKHAVKCALEGTPDMAKEAVKCIKQYSKSLESLEALHETLVSALHVGNPLLPTVITALKEIAKLETSVFELEVDVIIGEFAIKQVLRQDVDSHKSNKDEEVYDVWCSEDRLPKEVKIKILCIKLLENWLLGQVSLAKEKYDKVLVILHGILARKGDLNNSKSLSSGSLAHLRLCAAKVLIKLVCKRKDFSLSLSDFLQLSLVSQDPCMEVRKGFLEKLHKGLATCHLPLSYMAIFSFYGIESDKTVLATAKKYVQFNVDRRRKLAKELAVPKEKSYQLQPEFCVPYAIYMLAHHPKLSRLDFVSLDSFKDCLWFILEPIVKDGESHGVLYRILTSIKQSVDTQHPESSEANKKLYAMCDLAQVLIGSKATGAKASDRQGAITLPKHLYTHNEKNVYHVTDVFLPPDYVANLHKSGRTTPMSRAYGSPQRQSASRSAKVTPSSTGGSPVPLSKGKTSTSSSKRNKQEYSSSQEESPLKRPSKSKGSSVPKRHLAVADKLSTISETSEGVSISAPSSMDDSEPLPGVKSNKRRVHSKKMPAKEEVTRYAQEFSDGGEDEPQPKKKMAKTQKRTRKVPNKSGMESIIEEVSPSKVPMKKTSHTTASVKTKRRSKRNLK